MVPKYRLNIDIDRGFIDKFSLFGTVGKPYMAYNNNVTNNNVSLCYVSHNQH